MASTTNGSMVLTRQRGIGGFISTRLLSFRLTTSMSWLKRVDRNTARDIQCLPWKIVVPCPVEVFSVLAFAMAAIRLRAGSCTTSTVEQNLVADPEYRHPSHVDLGHSTIHHSQLSNLGDLERRRAAQGSPPAYLRAAPSHRSCPPTKNVAIGEKKKLCPLVTPTDC